MTHSITAQDFITAMNQSNSVVLDIRNTHDFSENHLSHALSIPATRLPNELKNLDRSATYYIISYSGRRSEIIANYLNNNGFQAIHVIGGMHALRALAA